MKYIHQVSQFVQQKNLTAICWDAELTTICKLKGTNPSYKLRILLRKLNSNLKKFEGSDLLGSC